MQSHLQFCRCSLLTLFILALSAIGIDAQEKGQDWRTLFNQGKSAFESMKPDDAVSLLTRALQDMPQTDEVLSQRIEAHQIRSSSHEFKGRRLEALNDARTACFLIRKRDGDVESATWIQPHLRVATLLEQTRQRKEALEAYRGVLAIARRHREPADASILQILYQHSRCSQSLGDWKGAEQTLVEYLANLEKAKGKNHPDLVGPLESLARCRRNLKDYQGAIEALERWVTIYETVRGKGSPTTGSGLRAIAECRVALNEGDTAEAACDRWQAVLMKVTPKHPEMIHLLYLRSQIDRAAGKFAAESAHLEEACSRMRALPEPDKVKLGELLKHQSVSYRVQARHEEALVAINETIALFTKNLLRDDPQRVVAREERGRTYAASGQLELAEKDFKAALAAWQRMAGDKHPVLRASLEGLLSIARAQKKAERVAELEAWLKRLPAKKS